jgi:DNA-binding GntR family transcriptional regulator
MARSSPAALAALHSASAQLERSSTAHRVADILRERILRGELPPASPLPEQQLTAAFGVSRNTVREAFQILVGEHLVAHQPHRGVSVRRLAAGDVRDIYAFRRLVEPAALLQLDRQEVGRERVGRQRVGRRGLDDVRSAVAEGRAAARRGDWQEVGTADVRFHLAVTALASSERLDRAMRALLAELRLAFLLVADAKALHAPYLLLNAEILRLAQHGDAERASSRMRAYLDEAEANVLAAVGDGGPST